MTFKCAVAPRKRQNATVLTFKPLAVKAVSWAANIFMCGRGNTRRSTPAPKDIEREVLNLDVHGGGAHSNELRQRGQAVQAEPQGNQGGRLGKPRGMLHQPPIGEVTDHDVAFMAAGPGESEAIVGLWGLAQHGVDLARLGPGMVDLPEGEILPGDSLHPTPLQPLQGLLYLGLPAVRHGLGIHGLALAEAGLGSLYMQKDT